MTIRNTTVAKCSTPSEARAEIERLMGGIVGFEGCTVVSVERCEDEAWSALIDDPNNLDEYSTFYIGDDGSCDWS